MKATRRIARLRDELRSVEAQIPDLEARSQGFDDASFLAGLELVVSQMTEVALSMELEALQKARAAKADSRRAIRFSIPVPTLKRLDAMAERVGVDRRALIQMAVFQSVNG